MKGLTGIFTRTLFFLAPLFWVTSCGEKRPEGILTREQMVEVMEEVYIAEEKVNQLGLPRDSSREIASIMTSKVFEKAGVKDSVFKRSFDYYMEHPRQMELIYSALVDTLQLREQRAPFRPDEP